MILIPLMFLGCGVETPKKPAAVEPTFLEVMGSLQGDTSADTGSPASGVLDFSNEGRVIQITGVTLNRESEPDEYNDWLEVSVRPGTIESVSGATQTTDSWGEEHWFVRATDGQVSTEVTFSSSFGNTRVWLTAVGDIEANVSGGSFATGVTESMIVELPTIAQMQDVSELEIDDPFT